MNDSVDCENQPIGQRLLLAGCALALLLGFAVLFRFDGLNNIPGVNGDEAWMGVQAEALLHGEPVAWRTPTGNVLNPFHLGPQVLFHAVGEPSIGLLRLTALLSSLLAIALNYWLASRLFDWRVAVASSALLALLPINIAYARFGWDASQTVLFALPVIYCPLLAIREKRFVFWLYSLLSVAAALLVHPTNIFLAPLLLVPAAAELWYPISQRLRGDNRCQLVTLAAIMTVALVAAWALLPWLQVAASRAIDFSQWRAFAVLYLDLLSGTTVYRFISGTMLDDSWWVAAARVVTLAVLCLAAVGYLKQWSVDESSDHQLLGPLALGYGLTLTGFFLIAGPEALQPHFERYGICLLPGVVVLATIGLRPWLFLPDVGYSKALRWSALSLAAVWLFSFQSNYLDSIRNSGGASHVAFRTGKLDPKEAALQEIAVAAEGEPVVIVAGEWWNYWPLRYLSYRYAHVEVVGLDQAEELAANLGSVEASGQVWFVEFHDSPQAAAVKQRLQKHGYKIEQRLFGDFHGRPVVEATQAQSLF